jgi:hypothetical protein
MFLRPFLCEFVRKSQREWVKTHVSRKYAKILEDKAVVSLIVRAKRQRGDSQFEGVYRNIRFFLKQDGRWQLTVWHNTKLS